MHCSLNVNSLALLTLIVGWALLSHARQRLSRHLAMQPEIKAAHIDPRAWN